MTLLVNYRKLPKNLPFPPQIQNWLENPHHCFFRLCGFRVGRGDAKGSLAQVAFCSNSFGCNPKMWRCGLCIVVGLTFYIAFWVRNKRLKWKRDNNPFLYTPSSLPRFFVPIKLSSLAYGSSLPCIYQGKLDMTRQPCRLFMCLNGGWKCFKPCLVYLKMYDLLKT